jgi:hypothetical protein
LTLQKEMLPLQHNNKLLVVFVAQLDRASDYGSEGLGFESLQEHKTQFFFIKSAFTLS